MNRSLLITTVALLSVTMPTRGEDDRRCPIVVDVPGTADRGAASSLPDYAAFRLTLAAREVRRYVYLRTGGWLPLADKIPAHGDRIALRIDEELGGESYRLRSSRLRDGKELEIAGGSPVAVLYGAYAFAEKLGVRFQLDGDVIPDRQVEFSLPEVNDTRTPLFATRGINPFHDFLEGPDLWETDDYLLYITQLARLKMNFIGLHCYEERPGSPGPEPLVWIGREGEFDPATGMVSAAYRNRWASTLAGSWWGYGRMPSSTYASGAGQLFEAEFTAPQVMGGVGYAEQTPEHATAVFNRVAVLLQRTFGHARELGVKTCIGTETPLTIPLAVRERLQAAGRNPADPEVKREIYRAMFARIAAAHPLDYYWLWTPETWTWEVNSTQQYADTEADIRAALKALDDLKNPFALATSGWVLGPAHDRAALNKLLPPSSPMSCINRNVGHDPVEPSFAKIEGRPKWAIPWLENDQNMVGPQPWVGRLRVDATDALRYGCTGLLGIHWRTRILSMNVTALAEAAWSQPWSVSSNVEAETLGALGGKTAFSSEPVEGTGQLPVYQSVRYDVSGYRLHIPNGLYRVTLKFVEPVCEESGKRRFNVKVQGNTVAENLDLFQRAGKNKALDIATENVRIEDGRLVIEFVKEVDLPCIAGIEIVGTQDAVNQFPALPYARRINCGGGSWGDFEADPGTVLAGSRKRSAPVEDFYQDWAIARFGPEAGPAAGRIFASVDGVGFPAVSEWKKGPGGITSCKQPWETESKHFAFVAALAALRPGIASPGDRARFDYWLETFRYARALRQFSCARGQLDLAMAALKNASAGKKADSARQALSIRLEMTRLWEQVITHQLAVVETPGELGTLMNLEQHSRELLKILDGHDTALTDALGESLPAEAMPSTTWAGPTRIIVPSCRSLASPGERLALRVLIPGSGEVTDAKLFHRPLGCGEAFIPAPLKHVGRAVYLAELPPATEDFEFHIQARLSNGQSLVWPPTAPAINQTVVILPN